MMTSSTVGSRRTAAYLLSCVVLFQIVLACSARSHKTRDSESTHQTAGEVNLLDTLLGHLLLSDLRDNKRTSGILSYDKAACKAGKDLPSLSRAVQEHSAIAYFCAQEKLSFGLQVWLPDWWMPNQGEWHRTQSQGLNSSAAFMSQSGEDRHALQTFFSGKAVGTFLEMGGNDGVTYSNTYHFRSIRLTKQSS